LWSLIAPKGQVKWELNDFFGITRIQAMRRFPSEKGIQPRPTDALRRSSSHRKTGADQVRRDVILEGPQRRFAGNRSPAQTDDRPDSSPRTGEAYP
jgi:hypothetical protein